MMCGWKRPSALAGILLAVVATSIAERRTSSFRVMASTDMGFAQPGWWVLEIGTDGNAILSRDGLPTNHFKIQRECLNDLRNSLRATFSMYPHQGSICVDCPMCILTVEIDGRQGQVYFAPFRCETPTSAEVRAARDALRLWASDKAAAGKENLPDPCSSMLDG